MEIQITTATSLAVGPYILQPNTTYTDLQLNFEDRYLLTALAVGTLVFVDGTDPVAYLQDPDRLAKCLATEAELGISSSQNIYGVSV